MRKRRWYYRALLLLFPRSFRRRAGVELERLLEDMLTEHVRAGGRAGVWFWARVTADAVSQAAAERIVLIRRPRTYRRRAVGRARLYIPRQAVRSAGAAARQAVRSVVRAPGLAIGIIVTLSLGVGANVTMFQVVDRLLLSPPAHIADAERVRHLQVERYVSALGERVTGGEVLLQTYALQRRNTEFEDVAAYSQHSGATLGHGVDARQVAAQLVTASFWRVLGVRPALGRVFTEAEDRAGAAGTVVIGHDLWRSAFGSSKSVIGRTLDVGGLGSSP